MTGRPVFAVMVPVRRLLMTVPAAFAFNFRAFGSPTVALLLALWLGFAQLALANLDVALDVSFESPVSPTPLARAYLPVTVAAAALSALCFAGWLVAVS